jgi:hypothetical protein
VLGLTKDDANKTYEKTLENLNLFFFAFFCFELFAKLLGEGFKYYLRDRFNWFDCAVVLVSAIDISLLYALRAQQTDGN